MTATVPGSFVSKDTGSCGVVPGTTFQAGLVNKTHSEVVTRDRDVDPQI